MLKRLRVWRRPPPAPTPAPALRGIPELVEWARANAMEAEARDLLLLLRENPQALDDPGLMTAWAHAQITRRTAAVLAETADAAQADLDARLQQALFSTGPVST